MVRDARTIMIMKIDQRNPESCNCNPPSDSKTFAMRVMLFKRTVLCHYNMVTTQGNSKFPIRLFFLSDTVWQTVVSPFSLMKLAWWSWPSGYQTNLSLCFVGKLLPD